jgi:hypothetical protein
VKHARKDYDRIQDPAAKWPSLLSPGSTAIGDDEPVFLLRSKDVSAPDTVRSWAHEHVSNGGDPALAKAAMAHAYAMEAWQQAHGGSKLADAPEGAL